MPEFMLITQPQVRQTGREVMVSADYLRDDGAGHRMLLHRACFRFAWDGPFTLLGGEAFITLGLLPAMKLGLPIVSEAAVAPGFAQSLGRLMEVIIAWQGDALKRLTITAPERPLAQASGRGAAAFFSCGVDSFYTVHTRRQELTHLLFIDGFDVDLNQTQHRLIARANAEAAAVDIGVPLIVVETDARFFLDRYAKWVNCGGTVAGAVAQLFGAAFDRVFFGSSHTWESCPRHSDTFPFASQFALADQDFSVEGLSVGRTQRVGALRDCPAALRHLRVCWEMPLDKLNCGHCEKCLRTMTALNACGLLGSCGTLPAAMDWDRVAKLTLPSDYTLHMWNTARLATTEPTARAHLDAFVARAKAERLALRLWRLGKEATHAEGWPTLARKLGKPMLATAWQHDRAWYLKKCSQSLGRLRARLFGFADRAETPAKSSPQ